MRRRDFIKVLGSAAAAWPPAARAQQAAVPIVGYLGRMAETDANRLRAVQQGLAEAGFAPKQTFGGSRRQCDLGHLKFTLWR
jgi:putative tryptophan/tyrosine transport system substrate-binding protein